MAGALMTVLGDPVQWGRWLNADSWLVVADRCRAEGRPTYATRAELIAKGLRAGWPAGRDYREAQWRIADQWNSTADIADYPFVRDTDAEVLDLGVSMCPCEWEFQRLWCWSTWSWAYDLRDLLPHDPCKGAPPGGLAGVCA